MSFELGTNVAKVLTTGPPPQQMYNENTVAEWMKESVLQKQQQQLDSNNNNNMVLDLNQTQKKKLKKSFYTPSRMHMDDQHMHLSSLQSQLSQQSPSHTCKDCLRSFKDINNYKEHRFQEHKVTDFPNIRQCKMCSYATLLKSKYDCHMRCHLNNKVIKCQRCNYSTINIRHMSKHERLHMINIKNKNMAMNSIGNNNGTKITEFNENNANNNGTDKKVNKNPHDLPHHFKRDSNNLMLLNSVQLSRSLDDLKNQQQQQPTKPSISSSPSGSSEAENDPATRELEISRNFFLQRDSGRKQSLSDETCSTHSSSSLVTPPWSSSSVSTSSQSPPLVEQPQTQPAKATTVNLHQQQGSKPSFHNILNLINSGKDNRSEASQAASPQPQIAHPGFFEQGQVNSIQQSFEESFRSNFENLIKLQLNNNLSASSFYSNLVNQHYHQQQHQNHLRQSILNQQQHHLQQNTSSHLSAASTAANFYQLPLNAQAFTTQADSNQDAACCDQKSNCNHRQELASLRENILKLLHGIMPQFVSMAGLEGLDGHCGESDTGRAQIDRMVDSLVQQINTA